MCKKTSTRLTDKRLAQGVPTIKLFKPTWDSADPRSQDVIVYNGERKPKAMADFMVQHMPSLVKQVTVANIHKYGSSDMPKATMSRLEP